MPYFSIVIPLYNKEKYVQDTLNSVLRQTFSDFEVIIVDDGSTDSSLKIVENIIDTRIRIFKQSNCGVSTARNHGISKATGDFICFLDADDTYSENCLAVVHDFINKNLDIEFYCFNYFRSKGGKLTKSINFNNISPFLDANNLIKDFFQFAAYSPGSFPCNICTVFIRRDWLEMCSIMFIEGVTHTEDITFVSELALKGRSAFCDTPIMTYYLETENNSKSTRKTNERYIIDWLVHKINLDDSGTLTKGLSQFLTKNILHLKANCIFSGNELDFINLSRRYSLLFKYCPKHYLFYFVLLKYLPYKLIRYVYLFIEKLK